MPDCPDEGVTQHHLGSPPGHGSVKDEEIILLAVFSSQARHRVVEKDFPTKSLKRGDLSAPRYSVWVGYSCRLSTTSRGKATACSRKPVIGLANAA